MNDFTHTDKLEEIHRTLDATEAPPEASEDERQHPSGGWGSAKAVGSILFQERAMRHVGVLLQQNKPRGFACVSCSWAKPGKPHPLEVCENGVKATAWELTSRRATPAFFAEHTVTELKTWGDHQLEEVGRLTEPMRWDKHSDTYQAVSWEDAFAEIGAELQLMAPRSTVFYASGRASLETSYMYQLLARMYGHNNLPDSSNMCHETTSTALPESVGVGVGTVLLQDFDKADCILFFGQNPGVNSPRMLHPLQEARKRGVPIITFNPLRERGLVNFVNPQSPGEMLGDNPTWISTQYHQVMPGGDVAALMGLCKCLIDADDAAKQAGSPGVLDDAFIAEHCHGYADFAATVRQASWDSIERESGLTRAALQDAADVYMQAKAVIGVYGMGLTQHRHGQDNVQMLCNLLLRGNMGKPGAGICPVRGHSNVQGQRTVGITEKPELAPLDQMASQFGFEPPRDKGMNTVEVCEAVLKGEVRAFVSLGGNFIRAVPETDLMEAAWPSIRLTVQISTKLNRAHLIHGDVAYILPCIGRIEKDVQASGPQCVAMEDSTGCMHGSWGQVAPAAPTLRSEPAIIAGIAKALLPRNPKLDWDAWVADYSNIRAAISVSLPEIFHDLSERMWQPGGFRRPMPVAERVWKTRSGKANFLIPKSLTVDPDTPAYGPDILRLFTVRSDGQFNTTIYTIEDRFRNVVDTRRVLLMHADDIERLGFKDGDLVDATTVVTVGQRRCVSGLRIKTFDVPRGSVAGYYPECNPLIPLWHHAEVSKVPAAKSIPVRLAACTPAHAPIH
ncbi:FdhF/YdeP family oxidoreductase [Silvimonas sp. JCM 19000]